MQGSWWRQLIDNSGHTPQFASACDKSTRVQASRLISCDERGVIFKFKDYRRKGHERYKTMALAVPEFIRRFLLHVLPAGFHGDYIQSSI